ncbi:MULTISPECIES: flavodoxin family protein [Methanoculleus]|uniref:NADPH-dependent FMN reductase n=2 Tax=Methanoculleus TaxID=45989 RepID=A3CU71_METMJ|nr:MULTISPECIES: flavodoxin family protein [Methanoculleus]ABN56921.1 NADPH-dependent FMN reductase [Methanoculleus marisnigri JR1]UYU18348.1 flavodoxin family protein [Methanoculleus submarinus]
MSESAAEKIQTIETPEGTFTLRLVRDDLGKIYPGMIRYTVDVLHGTERVYTYAINTYESGRRSSLFDTRKAAEIVFARLAHDVVSRPHLYTRPRVFTRPLPGTGTADVVILQGSPRRFGNSAKVASWCDDEATRAGLSSRVFYLQEMDIRPCIGCYVCYDQGYCPVEDDMPPIIRALEAASVVVVCTPVYTGTVPAALKAAIDRCQWLHAREKVLGKEVHARGLLIAVAGRRGAEPFICVTHVVDAFMENLGIRPAAPVLIGDLDRARDVETIGGVEDDVRAALSALLAPRDEE